MTPSPLDLPVTTRDLPPVRNAEPGRFPRDGGPFLVLMDGQIIGGGRAVGPEIGEPGYGDPICLPRSAEECWCVSDLDARHWAAVRNATIQRAPWVAEIRATLDRAGAVASRALERERMRREGAHEAQGAAIRTAADLGADIARINLGRAATG